MTWSEEDNRKLLYEFVESLDEPFAQFGITLAGWKRLVDEFLESRKKGESS